MISQHLSARPIITSLQAIGKANAISAGLLLLESIALKQPYSVVQTFLKPANEIRLKIKFK